MLKRHIDPTFLYIFTRIQPTATDILHIIAKYVPEKNLPLKCHMHATYASYFMCKYQTTLLVYFSYKLNVVNSVSLQALVYVYFTLLAYAPEHVSLPHCTCTSYYTNNVV